MGKVLGGAGVLLLGLFIVVVLMFNSFGNRQACNPAATVVDPKSVPAGPVSGYGHDQLVNAAIIAKVAADRGLPARAQLIGIMTSMGSRPWSTSATATTSTASPTRTARRRARSGCSSSSGAWAGGHGTR